MNPVQKLLFLAFSIFLVTGMAYVNILGNDCSTSGNYYMLFLSWLTLMSFALFTVSRTNIFGLVAAAIVSIIYIYLSSYASGLGICINFAHIEATIIIPFLIIKAYTIYSYFKNRIVVFEKYGEKINEEIADKIIKNPNYRGNNMVSVISAHIETATALHGNISNKKMNEIIEIIEDFTQEKVMEQDGTLEKLDGEETIAYWGQPLESPNHAHLACMTALEIQKKLNKFNNRKTILKAKVVAGIRTDRASEEQMEEKISEAKILENLNEYYKTNILIGEQTVRRLGNQFIIRHIDTINYGEKFKGLKIYELRGLLDGDLDTPLIVDTNTQSILDNHAKALEFYMNGDFKSALELFETNYREYDDVTALVFVDRIEKMKKAPKEWNGVYSVSNSDK